MPFYLYQCAYTPEAWAAQVENPQDVRQRIDAMMNKLGGEVIGIWYAFGEYDLVAVIEMPDNTSDAAAAIAIAAGGAVRAAKTTPLITIEEGLDALRAAAKSLYLPPE
jgi:uncharacterized protein with GYD domain